MEVLAEPLIAEGEAPLSEPAGSAGGWRSLDAPWAPHGSPHGKRAFRGYRRHLLEFRLVLTGQEAPGLYRGSLVFTLSRL